MLYFALISILLQASTASVIPSLKITYINSTVVTLTSATPSLSPTLMSQICNTGSWILYSGTNFLGGSVNVLPDGSSCITGSLLYGSARPVGSTVDITIPAINFYDGTNFQGEELELEDAIPSMDFVFNSFIISNSAIFQFFQGVNYDTTYDPLCILPNSDLYQVDNLDPEFYGTPWDLRDALSVKIESNANASCTNIYPLSKKFLR